MFGLNETEIQNGYNSAGEAPFDPSRDLSPGFFDGSIDAVGSGFKDASAKILQRVAAPPENPEDVMSLTGAVRATIASRFKPEDFNEVIKKNRPDPATTGWLGQQAFALSSMLSRAVAGSVVAGPVGGALVVGETERHSTTQELIGEGVDKETAGDVGDITGVTTGLGALLPAAIPGKLMTRLASGAAINVSTGGVARGLTAKTLEDGGYKDMAEQYRVFDAAAITTDAILGMAFGALHRGKNLTKPSDVDAALATNSWHQFEVESAPGIPATTAARNAHVDAMDLATAQLAVGDQVTVDLGGTDFIPKPKQSQTEAMKYLEENYNPAALSSLGESGTPSASTSVGDSPFTQDLPVQRSAKSEPSGPFAKRAITPSESLTGDVSAGFIDNSSSPIYHTVKDLQEITRTVQEIKPELDRALKGISSKIDGLEFFGSRIKEEDSLAVKAVRRKVQGISDYLGGRLVADSPKAIEDAVNVLREDYQVMKVDNFMDGNKPGGYRAVHLQVMSDKGVSVEVQIQPKEIRAAQDKGHAIYKKWQKVEAENGGRIPADQLEQRAKDMAGAQKIFEDAWKKWEKRNGIKESKATAEAAVVERNPDMLVMNEEGKAVTAKEALERASAEEAQAKQEASVFEAAVQCFLEVGDA